MPGESTRPLGHGDEKQDIDAGTNSPWKNHPPKSTGLPASVVPFHAFQEETPVIEVGDFAFRVSGEAKFPSEGDRRAGVVTSHKDIRPKTEYIYKPLNAKFSANCKLDKKFIDNFGRALQGKKPGKIATVFLNNLGLSAEFIPAKLGHGLGVNAGLDVSVSTIQVPFFLKGLWIHEFQSTDYNSKSSSHNAQYTVKLNLGFSKAGWAKILAIFRTLITEIIPGIGEAVCSAEALALLGGGIGAAAASTAVIALYLVYVHDESQRKMAAHWYATWYVQTVWFENLSPVKIINEIRGVKVVSDENVAFIIKAAEAGASDARDDAQVVNNNVMGGVMGLSRPTSIPDRTLFEQYKNFWILKYEGKEGEARKGLEQLRSEEFQKRCGG